MRMTNPHRVSLILTLLALVGVLHLPAWAGGEIWRARVIDAMDGDTLIVRTTRNPITIRLDGIDCPEWPTKEGRAARKFTRRLIGQMVVVHTTGADKWGRVVASIEYGDGLDLGEELLKRGLAKIWYPPAAACTPTAEDTPKSLIIQKED